MNPDPDLPAIRVLLIDSDEDCHVLIEDYLAESDTHRFVIDWVSSYEAALAAIARNAHDAYLVDYRLGLHTGLELLQELTVKAIDKPFIMLTGYDDPEIDDDALQAGVVDYLLKDDLNARLLARSIRYAINIKQTQSLLRDKIGELKTTQTQIIQAEKLSALGTLVAGVAHELNNPLMGVLNYVEYAQRRTTDSKIREVLDKALRETQRAKGIIGNMLTFAHTPDDRLAPVDVKEAIQRALELLATDLRKRRIAVTVALADALPPVWARLDGLQQVFINILSNARDALAQAPDKQIVLTGYRQEHKVCVAVRDTGCGIPAHLKAKIFDPFFTTKPPGQGTGLGMTVSRNILLSFGGTLTFTSQEGQGTTFTVTLRSEEPARAREGC